MKNIFLGKKTNLERRMPRGKWKTTHNRQIPIFMQVKVGGGDLYHISQKI